MKNKVFSMIMVLFIGLTSVQAQKTVSGVKVSEKVSFQGENLVLNGTGIREKMWLDLYVGALYLPAKSSSASVIVNSKDAGLIKLTIVSGMITSDKMISAVNEGFEASTNGNVTPIKAEITKFISFFKDKITKGDVFDIAYVPGSGVVVSKNGTKKGSIDNFEFKKALFGIWLGNNPADEDLKDGLLGK